jgi:SagB-type dehydrogenase family enzyme
MYWSPMKHWEQREGALWIDGQRVNPVLQSCFPEFYFFAQSGVTIEELQQRFPDVEPQQLKEAIEELLAARILIKGLLSPSEVCSAQERLYQNPYDPSLPYDEAKLNEYITLQLNRSQNVKSGTAIELEQTDKIPSLLCQRQTHRSFATEQPLTFARFSQLLAVLQQRKSSSSVRCYYPSAGGLYPLDFYLYVKPRRIEGVKQGFYYYDPSQHRLLLINEIDRVIVEDHFVNNQEIFRQSAFSLFIVYQADASIPKYGANGFYFACIEAGAVITTLQLMAETLSLGLCPIGKMKSEPIEKCLRLTEKHVFLHAVEGGVVKKGHDRECSN